MGLLDLQIFTTCTMQLDDHQNLRNIYFQKSGYLQVPYEIIYYKICDITNFRTDSCDLVVHLFSSMNLPSFVKCLWFKKILCNEKKHFVNIDCLYECSKLYSITK